MFKSVNEFISELGPEMAGKVFGKLTLFGIIGKGLAPGLLLIPDIELNPESWLENTDPELENPEPGFENDDPVLENPESWLENSAS